MNGAMITGHTQQRTVAVEVDTEYVGWLRAPPQLCQDVAGVGVKHSDERSLGAGRGYLGALHVELDDGEAGVVGGDVERRTVAGLEVHYLDVSGLGGGHGQHGVVAAGAEAHQTPGVGHRVKDVELRGRACEGEYLD